MESLQTAQNYCEHLLNTSTGLSVLRGPDLASGDLKSGSELLNVIEEKFRDCEEVLFDVYERRKELAWKGCKHAWEIWREKEGGGGEVGRCWIENHKNWKD
ncbi:hypothetical protein TrLO_g10191 [Triparma laevis f. longispina]|uniref:Uncharacterized protein n=1 Tax=Triparma laevis f. longispina TaxID=1714387 RepID=A0A9W7CF78_9STRA|nr:hypothetical protein TrLO_g10191 [Triparma laevis f. longispina]